jgi:uncharacterized protein
LKQNRCGENLIRASYQRKLQAAGAVLIRGAKACGKTESAKQFAKSILEASEVDIYDEATELEFIIEKITTGGFPGLINKNSTQATDINRAYIDMLAEADMSRVSNVKRDPAKVRNLLRSLARNTATTVETVSIEIDIFEKDSVTVSRPTIYDYLVALECLMIVENQPVWNTHLRSSALLIKAPKRHFTHVSLAVAALGANKNSLLDYIGKV